MNATHLLAAISDIVRPATTELNVPLKRSSPGKTDLEQFLSDFEISYSDELSAIKEAVMSRRL